VCTLSLYHSSLFGSRRGRSTPLPVLQRAWNDVALHHWSTCVRVSAHVRRLETLLLRVQVMSPPYYLYSFFFLRIVIFSEVELYKGKPVFWNPTLPYNEHIRFFFLFFLGVGGVRLSPLATMVTNWPIVPVPDDRWWWVWSSQWNDNWQGKPKYSVKTCPNATFPPQIPHDLISVRTRAATVGSRRLTAWDMARH
jgi:hypothetical protein